MGLRLSRQGDAWAWAAGWVALTAMAFVGLDLLRHPGFAIGDETDIVSFLQRVREGMPWGWRPGGGGLHQRLLLLSMELWPGALWATSLPSLLALLPEACLLFILGRQWSGSRAGFFAVLLGLGSAFTLLRARVGLSYGLFPLEFLALLWLREKAERPWHSALWGAALALCTLDYEAWIPVAALMLLLPPLKSPRTSARGYEMLGFVLALGVLIDKAALGDYVFRRGRASLFQASTPSAGFGALFGLLGGGGTLPYLAPLGVGVLLPTACLASFWGWRAWPGSKLALLLLIAVGLALPLMGGAPYGLPAHRAILLSPLLALVGALGLERIWSSLRPGRSRFALALLLSASTAHQGLQWWRSESGMDGAYRSPARNLSAAARHGALLAKERKLPFISETHPIKAPVFRYLAGVALPLAVASESPVLAYLPSEYLPVLAGARPKLWSFQELPGASPGIVAELNGTLARQASACESELRGLFLEETQGSDESLGAVYHWLETAPKSLRWARSAAVDYVSLIRWHGGRFVASDLDRIRSEPLVTARPLLLVLPTVLDADPAAALVLAREARGIDPANARARDFEAIALRRLGRENESQAAEEELAELDRNGRLIWE